MSTATATPAKLTAREALERDLQELADRGQIGAFTADNPTGNKLVWSVVLRDDTVDAVGDFDTASMGTAEARAFAAGVRLGARRKTSAGKAQKDNPLRNAILSDGLVEVEIADKDAAEQKRLRTAIFNAAYSLGLKGHFKVRTEEGKLVGVVTDKRVLRGAKSRVEAAA